MIGDVKAILEAGRDTANIAGRITELAHPDDPDVAIPIVLTTDRQGCSSVYVAKELLEELDQRRTGPHRRSGTTRITEVDSLIAFLKRWGSPQTVVYADTAALALVAVIDDHPEGAASAWRQHRAVYSCPRAAEWLAWTGQADKPMRQADFGDWIEARLEDLVKADGSSAPTEMLTIARQLHIKTTGEFKRDINPVSGDYILINKSQTDPTSTQIPRAFAIAIPCFEGGDRYQLEARLRFALQDGVPLFSFTLHRAKEIERDAFNEVRVKVGEATGMPVLAGTP